MNNDLQCILRRQQNSHLGTDCGVYCILHLACRMVSWLSGLTALVILLIGCCINFSHVVWLVVGALSAIAAFGELLVAINVVDHNIYCDGRHHHDCGYEARIVLAVIALALWTFVSVVTINFYRSRTAVALTSDDLPK